VGSHMQKSRWVLGLPAGLALGRIGSEAASTFAASVAGHTVAAGSALADGRPAHIESVAAFARIVVGPARRVFRSDWGMLCIEAGASRYWGFGFE
jgi:hypothetical protein